MADIQALLEVGRTMARLPAPWFVAGGWAIDCFLGRITREHHDVDILVFRRDQSLLHSTLAEFPLRSVIPDPEGLTNCGTVAEWSASERLELPLHQINVYRTANEYLTRADAAAADPEHRWWFQIMLGETDDDDWVYRRNPAIRRPLRQIGFHPPGGLPHLAPEIVLLFKSKHMLAHDRADFNSAAPALDSESRQWLRQALMRTAPDHEWLRTL
jgi:aminoglycoside-2''-adenylyltransferase